MWVVSFLAFGPASIPADRQAASARTLEQVFHRVNN
jgi:hypothetical protein